MTAGPLSGKIALVTGAGRGLGRGIARALARDGALVIVHYGESRDAAEAVVREIESGGSVAFALGADVANTSAVAAFFEALDRELERRGLDGLDVLVNNAGIPGFGDIESLTEAFVDRVLATNVKGLLFVTQHALTRMRDGGRIINISSVAGHNAYPGSVVYGATKAAVDQITRSLAAGLGPRGITVNAVAPGATRTDFIAHIERDPERAEQMRGAAALGRIADPEDVADVVAFLASDGGRWITGERICASGGMHL